MPDDLTSLSNALQAFVTATQTQNQEHIRPLHAHIVERLVIEGGFRPVDISPRPPLRIETVGTGKSRRHRLNFDPDAARPGEQTILGGLKTKNVDVVVSQRHVGPCLAVSVKGTVGAFRNLTNRMEEAAGDCTNLHISYPALVYGFLHVVRANAEADGTPRNDVAIDASRRIVDSIIRYHDAMSRLSDRRDLRNDVSRYEAVCLALVAVDGTGEILSTFPTSESRLRFESFFDDLYQTYDLRFVYSAPAIQKHTRRLEWSSDSPVLADAVASGFAPRIAEDG